MKTKKIKTFVITVSKVFPATHKRKGEPTYFPYKIINQKVIDGILTDSTSLGIAGFCKEYGVSTKIHTIRANYPFWKKRIEQVQNGEAVLSIRYWSGKPYNSPQVEVINLTKDDGVGVQRIEFYEDKDGIPCINYPLVGNYSEPVITSISKNDGLNHNDFKEWFKGYDLSEPMAIIHFTLFRY